MRTELEIKADADNIQQHIYKEKALHAAGEVTHQSHQRRMRVLYVFLRDLKDEETARKVKAWKDSNSEDYEQLMLF